MSDDAQFGDFQEIERERLKRQKPLGVQGRLSDGSLTDEFNAIESIRKSNESVVIGQKLAVASQSDPDRAAKALDIAERNNIPQPIAESGLEQFQSMEEADRRNKVLLENPALRRWIKNMNNAKVAHDDLDNLSSMEKGVDMLRAFAGNPAHMVGQMLSGAGAFSEGFGQWVTDRLDDIGLDALSDALRSPMPDGLQYINPTTGLIDLGEWQKDAASKIMPPPERQGLHTDIAGALGQIAFQIPATMADPALAFGSFGAMGYDMAYQRAKEAGADDKTAHAAGMLGGYATGLSEKLGIDKILERVPPNIKNLWARSVFDIAAAGGIEAFQEYAEGVMHNMIAAGLYDPESEIWTTSGNEEAAAGAAAGIIRTILHGVTRGRTLQTEQERTQEQLRLFRELGEKARQTKTFARHKASFESFVSEASDDAEVFLDREEATTYFQSVGVDPEEGFQMLGVADQVEESKSRGSDLVVPLKKLLAIADTSHFDPLLMSIKTDQGQLTPNEQFRAQENQAQIIRDEAEAIFRKHEGEQAWVQSSEQVLTDIRNELAGKFAPEIAERYAILHQAFAATLSEKLGILPHEVYQRYGLKVNNAGLEDLAGEVYSQTPSKTIPKKTVKAYKLFRVDPNRPGELFPLFVNANESVPMGQWFDAEVGPMTGGKVKSKIGKLAYRPGWHAGDLPIATHIGGKSSSDLKAPDYRPSNQVWAEVELPADKDWQSEANARASRAKDGSIIPRTAHITDQVPLGGHYRYKTNPNMTGEWLIGGSMKVNRVLSDDEVAAINDAAGVSDLPRLPGESAPLTLFQGPAQLDPEDAKWLKWKPSKTSDGKILGAPSWVNRAKNRVRALNKLIKESIDRLREGESGRYWYEDSARAVMKIVNGDLVEAEKFIQLLAIYSPQANVQVNTYFAVKAYTQWKEGKPISVKTSKHDKKAHEVLYENKPFDGRKTNSFYMNLMHDIMAKYPEAKDVLSLDKDIVESLDKPATIDMWMYRAFGYDTEQAGDDKGSGKYSFSEDLTRHITAKINATLGSGQERWTPHQVQAAIWSSMKARYEIPEVKEATWVESLKKGYAFINEKGERTVPTTAEGKREHLKIWRKHAMKADQALVNEMVKSTKASFETYIDQMTEIVTWEAIPSSAIGSDIYLADSDTKRAFTREAVKLILSEDGADLLAEKLGVPFAYIRSGSGAYDGNVTPNALSHIVPQKPSGEFGRDEVRAYARAIQYIYTQDAVPWYRPDPIALISKKAADDQKFRVINVKTGKTVPRSKVDTLAEAQAIADKKGEGFEVRGGKYARAVSLKFGFDVASDVEKALLDLLSSKLGDGAGFTRVSENEVHIVNYRDQETGVPYLDDEVFIEAIDSIEPELQALGVADFGVFWSEGEYGYVHDWEKDRSGEAILLTGALAGRPGLHAWLRDRRKAFEELVKDFSGEPLREAASTVYSQGPKSELPLNQNGKVPLTHWGRVQGLDLLDPTQWGTAAAGQERVRAGSDFRPRTYFGLPGYIVETPVQTRAWYRYFGEVDPDRIYDFDNDPLSLRDKVKAENKRAVGSEIATLYENAIADAGYSGYWGQHPAGPIAVMFEPVAVKEVPYHTKHRAPGGRGIAGYDGEGSLEEDLQKTLSQPPLNALDPWSLSVDEIVSHPDYLKAAKDAVGGEPTANINTPERQALRDKIANDLYGEGAKVKDHEAWILIGPPASGKSSLADQLFEEHGAMIIDSDMAKERLPEFAGGIGAGRVHLESKEITEKVMSRAMENGDNVIHPIVGANKQKVVSIIETFKEMGYTVHVRMVDLPIEETFRRSVARFQATGRFIHPDYIFNTVGYGPARTYIELANEGIGEDHEAYSSEVPEGEQPVIVDDFEAYARQRGLEVRDNDRHGQSRYDQERGKGSTGQDRGKGQDRGQIAFPSGGPSAGPSVISLFEGADLSTFLHESGHFFLEVYSDIARRADAPQSVRDDMQTLLDWFGVSSIDEIGRAQHEQFARGFEAYLYEGKAPTSDLQAIFYRFSAWLKQVYASIVRLNVSVSDEVKGVFDRMLASDAAIRQAEAQTDVSPLFDSAESAGMTGKEYSAYVKAMDSAKAAAELDLIRRNIEDQKREQTKAWKDLRERTVAEVEADIAKDKDIATKHFLMTGQYPGQEPGETALKPPVLDRAALDEMYGKDGPHSNFPVGKHGFVKNGGMDPEAAAHVLGYPGADALIQALAKAPTFREAVNAEVKSRMDAHARNINDNAAEMAEEAIKAVNSDERAKFISIELRALEKRANLNPTPRQVLKLAAERIVASLKAYELREGSYLRDSMKAARRAAQAVADGDFSAASEYKRQQLLNHYLFNEVRKAKLEVGRIRNYLAKFVNPGTRKNLSRDYLDQIDNLLESVDLKKSVSLKEIASRKKLSEWIQEQESAGAEVIIDPDIVSNAGLVSYKDMTFEQLQALRDSVKNVEHLGRLKQKLLYGREKRQFDDAKKVLIEKAKQTMKWSVEKVDLTKDGTLDKLKDWGEEYLAAHEKVEFIMHRLDGNKYGGPWWDMIFKPIADAESAEIAMQKEYGDKLTAIFDRYTDKEKRGWHRKIHSDILSADLNKLSIFAIALNWGNADNRAKLVEGYGWSEPAVDQFLMQEMKQKDWETVQQIWDVIDSLWPQIAALQKELTGVVPEKVQSTEVVTPYGTFRGGYYPLVYDADKSHLTFQREEKKNVQELYGSNFIRPATRKGHTIERKKTSGGQKVKLDLSVLNTHMTNVIHDLHFRKPIMMVDRILQDHEIADALQRTIGKQAYRHMRPWLMNIAADRNDPSGPIEKAAGHLRRAATIVNMGWKATTAIVQPLGYLQSIELLGKRWAMRGLLEFYGNPAKAARQWEKIKTLSPFMANRARTFDRDVRDSLKSLDKNSAYDRLKSTYFSHIGFFDLMVSVPTWLGGYERALSEGKTESDAVAFADSMVRMSQGAGGAKDLAAIQRGTEVQRSFTMFYSYFNVLYNLLARRGRISVREGFTFSNVSKITQSALYLIILPAVLSELIVGKGPDDDEDFWEWAAKLSISYPLSTMVGVRDLANYWLTGYSYSASPVADALEEFAKVPGHIADIWDGEGDKVDAKHLTMAGGYLLGLPTRQLFITGEHLWAVMNDDEDFSLYELLYRDRRD